MKLEEVREVVTEEVRGIESIGLDLPISAFSFAKWRRALNEIRKALPPSDVSDQLLKLSSVHSGWLCRPREREKLKWAFHWSRQQQSRKFILFWSPSGSIGGGLCPSLPALCHSTSASLSALSQTAAYIACRRATSLRIEEGWISGVHSSSLVSN